MTFIAPFPGSGIATCSYLYEKIEYLAGFNSTWTYTSVPFGTVTSDRRIIVITASDIAVVSSVVVAGISATNLSHQVWIADVPSGTSGTITVTTSIGIVTMGVAVYAAYGLQADAYYANTYVTSPVSISMSGSIVIPGGGFGIGYAVGGGTAASPTSLTWSGLTKDMGDSALISPNMAFHLSASLNEPQAGATANATATTNSGLVIQMQLISFSGN